MRRLSCLLLLCAMPLAARAGPHRRPSVPLVHDLRAIRVEPTWVMLQWSGPPGAYEISYRPRERRVRSPWVVLPNVTDLRYALVGLRDATTYEVQVRPQWPQAYRDRAVRPADQVLTGQIVFHQGLADTVPVPARVQLWTGGGARLEKPVLVDLLSGEISEIPKVSRSGGTVTIDGLPVRDYPTLIADSSVLS